MVLRARVRCDGRLKPKLSEFALTELSVRFKVLQPARLSLNLVGKLPD